MKQTSELAKALEVILKNSPEQANGNGNIRNGYATQPIVVYGEEALPEGELHLRDYWRTIRKRLWLIIGLALIVSAIAAIRQADQPDIFQARSRVQVDTETYSPALGASKGSSFYVDNSYMDPEYFNTQVQIVTSPTLLRRVAKTLDLEHNRTFLDPRVENRSTWQSVLRMVGFRQQVKEPAKPTNRILKEGSNKIPTSADFSVEDPGEIERLAPYVDTLAGMLDVSQVKKTRLIDIRASHTDPAVATKVVNTTADAFAMWNMEMKTKTNTVAGAYMQKRIAELQSQIRNGEEQLVNYAQSHEILSLDASQNTVVERLAGLNKELLVAENERNLAEAAYRTTRMMPGAAEANAEVSDKQIADFKSRLAELKQKRSQLLLTDTDESPEVRDVAQQIAVIEQQLAETRGSAKTTLTVNLETNYRKALAREKTLRESFNKQRSETVAQNQAAINYNILKQEIETNKGLLEGLMQRSKENDVSMAGTPNNIHVVDYSAVPPGPIGPRRTQAIMFASILALAFGVGLALFLEYLDDTIKNPNDIESGLRLPALAVIPMAGKLTSRLSPFTGVLHRGGESGKGPELLINTDGPSQQAEAYKHLRTSLLLSTPGRAPKTLLVTSSVPAEGKTTTVVNTATVLAQTGAKVLVIDADMRRPRLHHVFGLSNTAGLSAILSSEITEAETLAKINQYKDTNIYLLSSGAIPPNPAELLGSNQMKGLLDLAGDFFQYIVIDSPPIASFTDGVLISSLVDGVLLVVHGGKTSRQVVKRTRQMLQEIGAKIIGVVLNKAEVRAGDYYYYHYDYKPNYPKTISNGHSQHDPIPVSMLANEKAATAGGSSQRAS
ncbi:MAG TPA: polysaccharide biosynthesis tyrosine autokinase [Pyrinomonadaceae bacterium]|nr:polysaccharide biosynthesis tyrosine autokinase [Pyrinomonadaceae bacterium]